MSEVNDFQIKYRPSTLDNFIGNELLVNKIQNFIKAKQYPKSSLFTGKFGCGKTTLVYILKSLLECSDLNFTEINGGDSNGVDVIREIIKNLKLVPMGKSKTRIIFIDEAHKLTTAANSALLKDTEAADNSNVYFMLATNHPEKINDALRSRFTEFKVKPISALDIAKKLLFPICKQEQLDIDKSILLKIGEASNGSSRIALNLLNSLRFVDKEFHLQELENNISNVDKNVNIISGILYNKLSYSDVLKAINNLECEPEGFRCGTLDYLGKVLLDPNSDDDIKTKAYNMTIAFGQNYYDTGKAGLGMSIFDCFNK